MKKTILIVLVCLLLVCMAACSAQNSLADGLSKEGVAPYELSENERNVLGAFGIDENNAQMLSFRAPEETMSMDVVIYQLEGGAWEPIGGVGLSGFEEYNGGIAGSAFHAIAAG